MENIQNHGGKSHFDIAMGKYDNIREKQRFIKQQAVDEDQSSDDTGSYTDSSDLSDDSLEDIQSWQDEAMRTGELFYIEEDLDQDNNVSKPVLSNNLDKQNGSLRKQVKAVHSHTMKTIYVQVQAASYYGHKYSTDLLASMLGIITLDMRVDDQSDTSEDSSYEKLSVDVLVPGGCSLRTGLVSLGDVLYAVNDLPVTINNVEKVLRSVTQPSELKLTFQVDPNDVENLKEILSMQKMKENSTDDVSVVHLLSPIEGLPKPEEISGPHGVMFLTMNVKSDTAGDDDDLLYAYPPVEAVAGANSKLIQIRGVFLTLSDMIKDNFSGDVLSTSIMIGEDLVHCGYHKCESEILILCAPGSAYTVSHIQKVTSNAVRLINAMYGSLLSAFQPENKHRVDHLFRKMLTLNSVRNYDRLTEPFHLAHSNFLRLPSLISTHINAALSEFESSDFEHSLDDQHSYSRRLYNIRGSCLFHDEHLIANHLPTEDFRDVYLFCYNHALLEPAKKDKIGLLLIWRKVFRTRGSKAEEPGFPEAKGRYFWLIVGLKRNVFCALLQMNGKLFPTAHTPRPDPLYVNQAKATLLNLESYDLQEYIDQVTASPSLPLIAPASAFVIKPQSLFKSSKPPAGSSSESKTFKLPFNSPLKFRNAASDSDLEAKNTKSPRNPPKFTSSDEVMTPPRSRSLFRDKSFSSQGSAESFGSPKPTTKTSFAKPTLKSQFQPKTEVKRIPVIDSDGPMKYAQITTGKDNTLFFYVNLNISKGLIIMPTSYDLCRSTSQIDKDVVKNFRRYALIIHERLAFSSKNADNCHEEGVMFQCHAGVTATDQKKQTPHVQYWVVGRLIKRPVKQELYVCFNHLASQNVIELAFRMAATV